jgi:hypothetical protein
VNKILNVIAMVFVAFFAVLWLLVDLRLWHYTPTATAKTLTLSDPVIQTAGFLAATVGAGTAAVLGITIKDAAKGQGTVGTRVNDAVKASPLVLTGVLIYFFVGIATLAVWLCNPDEAPDLTKTFALGILGWAGGAFSAVFKST